MAGADAPKSLEEQVAIVGKPWDGSPYYDNAERWIHVFWDEKTVFRTLFERLDLTATLELSCGHGRHAEQIAARTQNLTLVDIHVDNLNFCRERLRSFPSIKYVEGNGYDFSAIESESITAIYCYDSMVHFSPDIVGSYLKDSIRILKPGGMALLHHSNFDAPLDKHYGQNPHARNHMTQALFREMADAAGLAVRESVVMKWGGIEDLDCLTLLQKNT